jgi:hypothetical protein
MVNIIMYGSNKISFILPKSRHTTISSELKVKELTGLNECFNHNFYLNKKVLMGV